MRIRGAGRMDQGVFKYLIFLTDQQSSTGVSSETGHPSARSIGFDQPYRIHSEQPRALTGNGVSRWRTPVLKNRVC